MKLCEFRAKTGTASPQGFSMLSCSAVFLSDDGQTHHAEFQTIVHNEVLNDPEQISALLADTLRALAAKLSPAQKSESPPRIQ
jgi:hypothetical protein